MKNILRILLGILMFYAVVACVGAQNSISKEDFINENLRLDNDSWKGWRIFYSRGCYQCKIYRDSVNFDIIRFFEKKDTLYFIVSKDGERHVYTNESFCDPDVYDELRIGMSMEDFLERSKWIISNKLIYITYGLFPEGDVFGRYDEGDEKVYIQSFTFSVCKDPSDASQPDSVLVQNWHDWTGITY